MRDRGGKETCEQLSFIKKKLNEQRARRVLFGPISKCVKATGQVSDPQSCCTIKSPGLRKDCDLHLAPQINYIKMLQVGARHQYF